LADHPGQLFVRAPASGNKTTALLHFTDPLVDLTGRFPARFPLQVLSSTGSTVFKMANSASQIAFV
jgi:hypothetical protein